MHLKRVLIMGVVIGLLFSALPLLFAEEKNTSTSAAVGVPDKAGYIWVDSNDPPPKVPYEWIDVRGNPSSTRVFYGRYYRYTRISFPFPFPFYDTALSGMYAYGCGLLTSKSGDRYYYYYSGDLNSLTSDYAIAPYWIYNGYTYVSIYTLSGTDANGTQWFAIEWLYPGYSGTPSNFEVILYDNGLIKFEFKTPRYYSYYQGGIVGIRGKMGSQTIVNHYTVRNSPRRVTDHSSVWFTSAQSTVWTVDLLNGDGVMGNVLYPYKENEYVIRVVASSEKGPSDLSELVLTLGPGKENIEFHYNFDTGEFSEENDPTGATILNKTLCRASLDTDTGNYTVLFYFKVTFNYPRESVDDYVDVFARAIGKMSAPGELKKDSLFGVEKRVELVGELKAIGEYNGYIVRGGWARGGETIWFVGLKAVYFKSTIELPPEIYGVEVYDQFMNIWEDDWIPHGETMNVSVPLPVETTYRTYNVRISGMVPEQYQELNIPDYKIRIDADSPGVPFNFEMHPDDIMDPPSTMDNDGEVYFTWDAAIDTSSRVKGYYVSLGPKTSTMPKYFVREPTTEIALTDLPEGNLKVYIWTVDMVGNEGNEIFARITIDKSPVEFSGFYPQQRVWLNTNRPLISIYINDTLSGVNPRTIQYSVSTSGLTGFSGWRTVFGYETENSIRVVVQPTLKNGQDNFIKFRAKDMVGNGYVESPPYNLWVDTQPVRFTSFTPREDEWQSSTKVTVSVKIDDRTGSGVDPSSIEYCVSTRGIRHYSPWMRYTEARPGSSVIVQFTYDFARGDQNYVKFRARDLAGNPVAVSKDYRILVHTLPTIIVTSPPPDDIYLDNETITFDASKSFDQDGDPFDIVWTSSISGEIGRGELIMRKLPEGEHLITVSAVVNEQVLSTKSFTITVYKHKEGINLTRDSDNDGIKDWWEEKYGLDPNDKADAMYDPDKDGYNNLQEYMSDTDPKNPFDHPVELYQAPPKAKKALFSLWILIILIVAILAAIMYTAMMQRKLSRAEKKIQKIVREKRLVRSVADTELAEIYNIGVQLASGTLAIGLPSGGVAGAALPEGAGAGVAGYLPPSEKTEGAPLPEAEVEKPPEVPQAPPEPTPEESPEEQPPGTPTPPTPSTEEEQPPQESPAPETQPEEGGQQ